MIDFFKELMEQALELELAVRFTKQDGEWFAALGGELDSLSLEELEEYRAELETRLCDMDEEEPEALCVTFDRREPTFRHLEYDGYKAQRKGMD